MIASHRAWKSRLILSALALSMGASAVPSDLPRDGGGGCAPAWSATSPYTGGSTASVGSVNYTANYWSQGANPSIHNGRAGRGEPWTAHGSCSR